MEAKFVPTHIIATGSGEVIEVHLIDGQAFQRHEWEAGRNEAEYERHGEGRWTYMGQRFKGGVKSARPKA